MAHINLEDKYNNKKGIYVLTLTGERPFKIGMTNQPIYKRINSYVNCPSSHQGHYIHLLLTYDVNSDLNAKSVEGFIFRKLDKFRLNSNQRKMANKSEHFDISLKTIKKVFEEAKIFYEDKYDVEISVDKLGDKTVKTVIQKGKRNVLLE